MSRKRTNNNNNTASEDEVSDSEETHGKKSSLDLPVFEFRDLIEALDKVCGAELTKLTAVTNVAKLVEKHEELKPFEDLVNSPNFIQQWKALYTAATRPKNITLADANSYIKRFLSQGETVTFFDGYPANPRRAIDYYVAAKRKPNMTVSDSAKIRKQYKDDPEVEKYKKLGDADRVRFATELKAFLEANEARLTEEQKKYVAHRIKGMEPPSARPPKASAAKKAKKEKPKKTALQWFAQINAAEFEKYEGEKREKRIAKKFGKLTEGEVAIYEKLANS